MLILPKISTNDEFVLINDNPTISVWFGVPAGGVAFDHLIECVAPFIVSDVGE